MIKAGILSDVEKKSNSIKRGATQKKVYGVSDRSDINRPVQSQKQARGLKFQI